MFLIFVKASLPLQFFSVSPSVRLPTEIIQTMRFGTTRHIVVQCGSTNQRHPIPLILVSSFVRSFEFFPFRASIRIGISPQNNTIQNNTKQNKKDDCRL